MGASLEQLTQAGTCTWQASLCSHMCRGRHLAPLIRLLILALLRHARSQHWRLLQLMSDYLLGIVRLSGAPWLLALHGCRAHVGCSVPCC